MVNVYHANRLMRTDGRCLTAGGILAIALLCGGDYDPVRPLS